MTTSTASTTAVRRWGEVSPPNRAMFASYARLLRFVRPYWRQLALASAILVINSLASLALPMVVRVVVDSALVQGSALLLNRVTLLLLALFALQAVLGFGQSYLLGWTGERVVANLRKELYAHLHAMPLRFFANTRIGELLSRLGNDVTTIQNAVTDTLLSLLSNTIMLVGGIVIIFVMAWRLTLVMLAVVPLAILGMILLGRIVRRLSKQVQDALADTSAIAEEALAGERIVKTFAREPYEVGKYSAGVERLFAIAMARVRLSAILGPIIGFIAFSAIALVLWFGSREVIGGRLTPGELISFLLYTMMVASPIASFTGLYGQFQRALGASEHVFDLLDTPPEMQDAPDAVELPTVRGEVCFDNVSFDYAEADLPREVLRDVDLTVPPGQVIALVGPSGAGKTTLVHLIPRFYDVTEGRITIDGYNIQHVKMRSLREQIGIVPQETVLFSGSVGDNIRYGKLDATQGEVEAAARAANAHDFVMDLPKGYDTLVGERGVKLSGGQRQRVAIARALLKDPRIMILDEATSSLDTESEQAVQEALERLMRGRTTFVIAHRLSTITGADWIAVINNGRIVEQGTHETLVAQEGGLYRRMYALQFRLDGAS
ncbi:MAG: ABC transporter ATP-binding protein [Nitrososphaerales archaeon]